MYIYMYIYVYIYDYTLLILTHSIYVTYIIDNPDYTYM